MPTSTSFDYKISLGELDCLLSEDPDGIFNEYVIFVNTEEQTQYALRPNSPSLPIEHGEAPSKAVRSVDYAQYIDGKRIIASTGVVSLVQSKAGMHLKIISSAENDTDLEHTVIQGTIRTRKINPDGIIFRLA